MTDKAASANDRVVEAQGAKGLNVASAGLDPCKQAFNDSYHEMMKTQLAKITGQEIDQDTLRRVEDRLSKNGVKLEEQTDAEQSKAAVSLALKQVKDAKVEEEQE